MVSYSEKRGQRLNRGTAELVRLRRELHRIPEIGHHEFRTRRYIETELRRRGIAAIQRVGMTSLYADIGRSGAPTVAFRADMDGLAFRETSRKRYRSVHEGVMHGCGHDGHMAVLIGLADFLVEHEHELSLSYRLIFQESEEAIPSGARQLVREGIVSDRRLREVFGFHLWPRLPVGTIGISAGVLMRKVDLLNLRIEGSLIEERVNPVEAAIQLANELFRLGRSGGQGGASTIVIRQIEGGIGPGSNSGVIRMRVLIRSNSTRHSSRVRQEIHRLVRSAAIYPSLRIVIEKYSEIRPLLRNSRASIKSVKRAVRAARDGLEISELAAPVQTSEDFGYYLKEVPGAFILIGCGTSTGSSQGLHERDFDFDELALSRALVLLEQLVWDSERRLGHPRASGRASTGPKREPRV